MATIKIVVSNSLIIGLVIIINFSDVPIRGQTSTNCPVLQDIWPEQLQVRCDETDRLITLRLLRLRAPARSFQLDACDDG